MPVCIKLPLEILTIKYCVLAAKDLSSENYNFNFKQQRVVPCTCCGSVFTAKDLSFRYYSTFKQQQLLLFFHKFLALNLPDPSGGGGGGGGS